MIRILSLGAGVQSTTILLMMLRGEIAPPIAAIFADTQAEPTQVYAHLDWCEKQINGAFPLIHVSAGNLETQVLESQQGIRPRLDQPPFYVMSPSANGHDPDKGGMIWRQCTRAFKLEPLRREVKRLWRANGRQRVTQVIGISIDEQSRCKDSGVKYIENDYPLVTLSNSPAMTASIGCKAADIRGQQSPHVSSARTPQMQCGAI